MNIFFYTNCGKKGKYSYEYPDHYCIKIKIIQIVFMTWDSILFPLIFQILLISLSPLPCSLPSQHGVLSRQAFRAGWSSRLGPRGLLCGPAPRVPTSHRTGVYDATPRHPTPEPRCPHSNVLRHRQGRRRLQGDQGKRRTGTENVGDAV